MRANFLAEYSEIQVENSRRIYAYKYCSKNECLKPPVVVKRFYNIYG